VVRDPERDAFIKVMIKPAAHLDELDEVLVVTSTEPRFPQDQQQDMGTSVALKGAEAETLKKASDGMAEKLPGLIDPNLPSDQQPLHDTSNPNPVSHPPQALHPDRFTPENAVPPATAPSAEIGAGTPQQSVPAKKKPAAPPAADGSAPPSSPARTPSAEKQQRNR